MMNATSHQAVSRAIDNFDQMSKEDLTDTIKRSTYIGLAHPIYGADMPPIMKEFACLMMDIIKSEKIPAKPFYIINTFGYVNAFGPFAAQ